MKNVKWWYGIVLATIGAAIIVLFKNDTVEDIGALIVIAGNLWTIIVLINNLITWIRNRKNKSYTVFKDVFNSEDTKKN